MLTFYVQSKPVVASKFLLTPCGPNEYIGAQLDRPNVAAELKIFGIHVPCEIDQSLMIHLKCHTRLRLRNLMLCLCDVILL